MSDDDESLGDRLSNVAYDATEGVVDVFSGDGDGAVDHFLDMSRDALDVVTDGGFSSYVDRENAEHDTNLREDLKDGLETAGNWIGDEASAAVDWVGETAHDVGNAVDEGIDWVGNELSELNPFD